MDSMQSGNRDKNEKPGKWKTWAFLFVRFQGIDNHVEELLPLEWF